MNIDTCDQRNPCKGRIYRYHIHGFWNRYGDYCKEEKLVLQHRLSCKGCSECEFSAEALHKEEISYNKQPIHLNYYKLVYVHYVTGSDGIFEDEGYFEFQEIDVERL